MNIANKPISNIFPCLKTATAYYDPATFYIHLCKITREDLREKSPESSVVLMHEMRHYIDHISTLWGQKHILKYLKAICARFSGNENEFFNIYQYKREEKIVFYKEYYTEIYECVTGAPNKWRMHPSIGAKFDAYGNQKIDEFIPFVRFFTNEKEPKPLHRFALSISSLLEINAVFEQIRAEIALVYTIQHENDTTEKLEIERIKTEYEELVYNQDLMLYNAGVHFVASMLKISDIVLALEIAAQISALTLNIPNKIARKIKISDYFNRSEFGNRPCCMLASHEYGFIFMLLVMNYKDSYIKNNSFCIDTLLKDSQLPKKEEIEQSLRKEFLGIKGEIETLKKQCPPAISDKFVENIERGQIINEKMGLCYKNIGKIANVSPLPTIICQDEQINDYGWLLPNAFDECFEIYEGKKNMDNVSFWNIMKAINANFDDFCNICGV